MQRSATPGATIGCTTPTGLAAEILTVGRRTGAGAAIGRAVALVAGAAGDLLTVGSPAFASKQGRRSAAARARCAPGPPCKSASRAPVLGAVSTCAPPCTHAQSDGGGDDDAEIDLRHGSQRGNDEAARPAVEPARLELSIEDAVSRQIDACDPQRTLDAADFYHVLTEVTNTVMGVMMRDSLTELDEQDRAFICRRVQTMVQPGPGASEAMVVTIESEGHKGFDSLDSSCLVAVPEDTFHLQRAANSDGLVCYRLPAPADSERATGVERKRSHVLTYLGRVIAV